MTDEISKAVESANKNLDNALEVAVDALKECQSVVNNTMAMDSVRFHCIRNTVNNALTQIAAILKVRQKDK